MSLTQTLNSGILSHLLPENRITVRLNTQALHFSDLMSAEMDDDIVDFELNNFETDTGITHQAASTNLPRRDTDSAESEAAEADEDTGVDASETFNPPEMDVDPPTTHSKAPELKMTGIQARVAPETITSTPPPVNAGGARNEAGSAHSEAGDANSEAGGADGLYKQTHSAPS